MASEFKHLKFGLVPSSLDLGAVEANEQIFKSFLKSLGTFNLIDDSESHIEVFAVAKTYIGDNFRNWLIVNFRNGGGARKELVRKIAGYIDGRLPGRSVIGQIKIDLNRISHMSSGDAIKTAIIYDEYQESRNQYRVEDISFAHVENRHMYDFFALVGPELIAKFCLSLEGIYYDG